MKMTENTRAIILLIVLISIGGIVMYGQKAPNLKSANQTTSNETRR